MHGAKELRVFTVVTFRSALIGKSDKPFIITCIINISGYHLVWSGDVRVHHRGVGALIHP